MRHYCKNQCKQIVTETSDGPFLLRFMQLPANNTHMGGGGFSILTIVVFAFLILLPRSTV